MSSDDISPTEVQEMAAYIGWSPRVVASKCGVSISTVRRWYRGRSTPPVVVINYLRLVQSICGVFGGSVNPHVGDGSHG